MGFLDSRPLARRMSWKLEWHHDRGFWLVKKYQRSHKIFFDTTICCGCNKTVQKQEAGQIFGVEWLGMGDNFI
jgi:hypothetical protein